jgi:hypothetical protein
LKRRNVFRVGIAYVLMGWGLLQAADFALAQVIAIMGIERFVSIDKSAPTNPSAGGARFCHFNRCSALRQHEFRPGAGVFF